MGDRRGSRGAAAGGWLGGEDGKMNIQSDSKRYLLSITGILAVAGVAFFLGRHSVGPSPVEGVTGRTEAAHREEGHAKEAGSAEGQAADSHGDETRGEKGLVKFE